MKRGWQITNATRRTDNGFVTNVTCVYAQTASNHIEKISYTIINEYNGLDDDFIPFEDLTHKKMLDWCFKAMGSEKKKLETKIKNKHKEFVSNRDRQQLLVDGLPY